jgi:hypothetical protein
MPAQKPKSASLSALTGKLKASHKKAVNAPVKMPNMDPPAGIDHGTASLVDCRAGVYNSGPNKGKLFFLAAAIIKTPKAFDGRKCEGIRIQYMEPLCDTKTQKGKETKFDEHLANVYGWIKFHGGEELLAAASEDIAAGVDGALEGVFQELKDAAPTIAYRTWKGKPTKDYPNPRVNVDFCGVCEETEEEGGEADVIDESAADEAPADDDTPAEEAAEEEAPAEEEATEEAAEDAPDLDALAKAADAKKPNEAAIEQLQAIAIEAGVSEEDFTNAENYASVVEMIRELQNPTDSEEAAEEEADAEEEVPADPEKGEVYSYVLIDPKTKKPVIDPKTKKAKKPAQVEAVAVYKKNKTADVKNLADDKVIKGVAWDKLLPPA